MKAKTILLVEDDFLNRRLSKKTLLGNGYHVLEAKNTREAFKILESEEVDLVILDINLGEDQEDGISLGRAIHVQNSIPFLYLTAYETEEVVKRAIATKPQAYITKPFKDIDFLAAVALAIRHFASLRQRRQSVVVKDDDYSIELPIDKIDYIESEGNYLLFYAVDRVYRRRSTIKQILELLPSTTFIQTHRAFVVNKTKVDKFNVKQLVVKNEIIPVSKNYIDNIRRIYG